MFTMNTLIDEDIFNIKLNASFLSNSPSYGMFKTANISLALLQIGKDNNLHKPLLQAIFSFSMADLVESSHIAEQYIVEQYVLNK